MPGRRTLEQTEKELFGEGFHIRGNTVVGGTNGIGVKLVKGFDIAGNTIVTADGMGHGIIIDHLDDTVNPSFGSVTSNSVVGDDAVSEHARLIGNGEAYVSASDNTAKPAVGGGFSLGNSATYCTVNGMGKEDVGARSQPSEGWSQHSTGVIVRNYSDETYWLRKHGGWVQIAG